ncbi:MAG: deoxyhypusine synthase [Nitrososphaerota archaeon]|jgi:deoxyhypusine synthase|nr:deoxyhypusine synthase [Nitrososphaerota archaeon]MDG6927258.1 deoxyhypusine synthase [Nitrososphaerota archaeon]MDG6930384.1 deoxyhypusine synthase [Nitrososphaerota archaeon]MDG6932591.1 deoxyhypusine synthase [Nitrososphaerota archaeon]MDG6935671.1 deoxyhypusine synthase [Nitrososphaerota archaeon]
MNNMESVEDIILKNGQTPSEILNYMLNSGGFSGRELAEASVMLKDVIRGSGGRILTFPADIIATGARGIIVQLIKEKAFDLVITTCGALDHDIARTYGKYYRGTYFEDDAKLLESGFHRLGNVLVPVKNYGELIESKMQDFLKTKYGLKETKIPTYRLAWDIGEYMHDNSSLLYWAYKNEVPVIVPGITDGAVGYQLWLYRQSHKNFLVDVLEDETAMSDFVFTKKSLGALIIGGGISKHHAIWWSQFIEGLDSAVYLTSAYEYDGSLSGALTKEAVSWGKIKPKGRHVTVHVDATIALPFIVHAALFG